MLLQRRPVGLNRTPAAAVGNLRHRQVGMGRRLVKVQLVQQANGGFKMVTGRLQAVVAINMIRHACLL